MIVASFGWYIIILKKGKLGGMSMWDRTTIKLNGNIAFKRNYWRSVLVAFIVFLLTNGVDTPRAGQSIELASYGNLTFTLDVYDLKGFWAASMISALVGLELIIGVIGVAIIGVLIDTFLFCPIQVGGCCFFVENAAKTSNVDALAYAFQSNHYGTIVLTMFLRKLYTILWGLLLIIPGIVKSYEYQMIPYILADMPDISRRDAFLLSKKMMDGQKLEAFVLDLSFLGWGILSLITFGIAGIFYVNPYQQAVNAELYLELKKYRLEKNTII